MLYRNKIRTALLSIPIVLFTNVISAHNLFTKVEKLAEHDALEVLGPVLDNSDQDFEQIIFKGKPWAISLNGGAGKELFLYSLTTSSPYNTFENHNFSLKDIVAPNTDYELTLAANDDAVYALLTNNDDSVRTKKNLLLKSSNGATWELYKSFPAEWELLGMSVDGNNISVSCLNCEDTLKISYMLSADDGKSWKKYSLPETSKAWHYSGFANEKMYVVAEVKDPQDRKKLVNELFFTTLQNKTPTWVQADLTKVATLEKGLEVFKFKDVEQTFYADGYLLANVTYSLKKVDEEPVETDATWISRDNGNTWDFFKMQNLNSEMTTQFKKHGESYYLVTRNRIDEPDEDSDDAIPLDLFVNYIKEQKYSYYKLAKDDLNTKQSFTATPSFELEHGLGFNIDYKLSPKADYVDMLFLNYKDDRFKLSFYRLHS